MRLILRRSLSMAGLSFGAILVLTQVFGAAAQTAPDLVIRQGHLVPMVSDDPKIVAIKGIVINGGKIERIVPAESSESLPRGRENIDASSLFILPGLIDAHVHFRPWFPELFLHYGVTSLMDTGPCGADCPEDPNEWILRFKRSLNDGQAKGPSLYITGMKLDGPKGKQDRHVYRLQSLEEIAEKIELLSKLGVDAIKVEDSLPIEFRRRIVEEAERKGLTVVGHAPNARESLSVGMRFVEHMYPIVTSLSDDPAALQRGHEYLLDLTKAPALIEEMVAKRVYLNPTLLGGFGSVTNRRRQYSDEDSRLMTTPMFASIPEEHRGRIPKSYLRTDGVPSEQRSRLEESYRKVQMFLREFHAKGGLILAASDATENTMPGLATHREMQLLVDAGVSPYAALLGATRYPAQLMRKQNIIGTAQEGRRADLMIIAANPIEDIASTQKLRYVIRNGKIERRATHEQGSPE